MRQHPVRVGVVGVGYVGALHAKVYSRLPEARLVAVCDVNTARANDLAGQLGCQALGDARALVGMVDAVSVAVPTSRHAEVATPLLHAGIHVLIEKPITADLKQAQALLALAKRKRLTLQVGHIERFNAAIQEAQAHLTHPRFIEVHRLSPYPHRGTDVSVVLDVMIHDLDLILALLGTAPSRIDAVGVPVLSASEDIANARLAFPSGCVANLTASRVSEETMRRIRVFQEDCYLSIDYKAQTVDFAQKIGQTIQRKAFPVRRRPPLDEELAAFVRAVTTKQRPLLPAPCLPSRGRDRQARNSRDHVAARQAGVSGEEARQALALALKIEQVMRKPVAKWQEGKVAKEKRVGKTHISAQ